MAKVEKSQPYITPDGVMVPGRLITDTATGASEWYVQGAAFPTFVSDKNQINPDTNEPYGNYNWRPHSDTSVDNLVNNSVPLLGKPPEKASKYQDSTYRSDQGGDIEGNLNQTNTSDTSLKNFNETRIQSIEDEGTSGQREEFLQTGDNQVPGAKPTIQEQADAISEIPTIPGIGINDPNFSGLRYPIDIDVSTQDIITITVIEYGKKTFNVGGGNIGFTNREFKEGNTVILPVQAGLKDQNMVKWSGETMDPVQTAAASMSQQTVQGDAAGAAEAGIAALDNAGVSDAIVTALTQKAAGATGLLSRLGGAIANPNLELLFQGPELRPFSLSFFMSPRSEEEAVNVRKIIRFFKQHMAVKRSTDGIFLKAPDIFRVKFETPAGEHGSINRFKECALLQMSVDYTPGGSYSTYNDQKHTMTAYRMDLSFQELEPVFADEYEPGSRNFPRKSQRAPLVDEIGY